MLRTNISFFFIPFIDCGIALPLVTLGGLAVVVLGFHYPVRLRCVALSCRACGFDTNGLRRFRQCSLQIAVILPDRHDEGYPGLKLVNCHVALAISACW